MLFFSTGLGHLCEFIEDCEHTVLATRILHLLGREGPRSQNPSKYIRFIYNRVILENAAVRAGKIIVLWNSFHIYTTHIITHSFKHLYLVNTITFHPGSKSYLLTVQVAYMTLLGKWLFSVTHSSKRTTFQSGYRGFASTRVRPCHLNDFAPTFTRFGG